MTLCGICHKPVDWRLVFPDRMSASVDHIIARMDGGSDNDDNLQLAHYGCNSRKGTERINEYRREVRKDARAFYKRVRG